VARVFIPTMLRPFTRDVPVVTVAAANVAEVIDRLDERFPGFRDAVVEDGELHAGLAVSIDSEVAVLGLLEPVGRDSEVHFLPAIAGGG
jgi:molybdopterin converting factor small subunit